MKRRILVSECKQEISSFNPVLGRYEDFSIDRGPSMVDYHRPIRSEMGGALAVLEAAPDVEVVPGYCARAVTSGGTVAAADFARIAAEFLAAVSEAGPLDGIYFSLHGAMAAEDEIDPEGYLLAETRKIVGDALPIAISLDLHGILTDRMLRHADVVTVFHTNPHVDFYETGERAARLLLRFMAGEIRPVAVRVPIPALVRGQECMTATGMWGACMRRAIAFENSAGGLSGSMFIGNPFTDVPDLFSNVFLMADGDEAAAVAEAVSIAEQFWGMRHHLQQPLLGLRESAREACSATGRVVLVDAADATSSGASGDSNAILRALLEAGCERTALIPIVDEPAAIAAARAGIGAEVTVPIGGSLDARFEPVIMTGRVRLLYDGRMVSESHGEVWQAGLTAVLEFGVYTLVVMSRAVSLYDRTPFLACGLDPAAFAMTVVKSPLCQPRFFNDGAEKVLNIDAPGATSANLRSLGHKVCHRPMFPLDEGVTFTPQARVMRRAK